MRDRIPHGSFSPWGEGGDEGQRWSSASRPLLKKNKTPLKIFTSANSQNPHPNLLPARGEGEIQSSPHPSWLGSEGTQTAGRLFFAYFLLAKQKKVSSRRATPGQPPPEKPTQQPSKAVTIAPTLATSEHLSSCQRVVHDRADRRRQTWRGTISPARPPLPRRLSDTGCAPRTKIL